MAIEQTVRRRVVGEMEFIFYAHDELIVKYKNTAILFHSWGTSNRRFTFRVFRKALMYQKSFTYNDLFVLARRHDVQWQICNYMSRKVLEAEASGSIVELSPLGRVRSA